MLSFIAQIRGFITRLCHRSIAKNDFRPLKMEYMVNTRVDIICR